MKAVVIHLAKAVERLPLVENINKIFPLDIYDANDGSEWQADPTIQKAHPWTKKPVTQGTIGCTYSHIDLINAALKAGDESIMIFEDDCDFKPEVDTATMMNFIEGAPPYDILLLGGTEYVESEAAGDYKKVGRFWGAHALILKERAMRAALKAFAESQKKGEFLHGDWLYNGAIKEGLTCYGPADPFRFCKQKEGLLSYLTGTVRKYRA